jgi:hypothetical protein
VDWWHAGQAEAVVKVSSSQSTTTTEQEFGGELLDGWTVAQQGVKVNQS